MKRLILILSVMAPMALLAQSSVAADFGTMPVVKAEPLVAVPGCGSVWTCGPYGCGWRHVCRRVCPSRYSCSPLYGAYGPFGGTGYWGAYTLSGWGRY
jgi:hypothetical protein